MTRKQLKAIDRFDIQSDRPQTTIYKDLGSPKQRPPKMMKKVWESFQKKHKGKSMTYKDKSPAFLTGISGGPYNPYKNPKLTVSLRRKI